MGRIAIPPFQIQPGILTYAMLGIQVFCLFCFITIVLPKLDSIRSYVEPIGRTAIW